MTDREIRVRVSELLVQLQACSNQKDRAHMKRAAMKTEDAFGVSVYTLRAMAKDIGVEHELALALWASGNREARLLACFVDDAGALTSAQMEAWAGEFDSWEICDQATTSLFDQSPLAWTKAREWARREEEWVRRGGFALMAGLAVHDKVAPDVAFAELFPLIVQGAFDDRNFVKKAVSWALRNIGKRNLGLNTSAAECAERIRDMANERAGGERGGDSAARSARWVASDVLRELTSERIRSRLGVGERSSAIQRAARRKR